jgi:hypothetical protein
VDLAADSGWPQFSATLSESGVSKMKRAAQIAIAVCLATAFLSIPASAQVPREQNAAALALVKRAIAVSDIQTDNATAFSLRAHFSVYFSQGKFEKGEILRIWTPAGMWHYEQSLADYHSVEVTAGKEVWKATNLDYVPFPVFLAQRALALPGELTAATGRALAQPFLSVATEEKCVRTSDGSDGRKYCFSPQTGELRQLADKSWNVTYEYSDYQPFGTKSFPRLVSIVREDGRVFVEIHIDELKPVNELDLRTFLPVKGSKEHHIASRCMEIERPKLEKMVQPVFPKQAEAAGLTGVVRLYAEIGTDGIPRGMWPINTSVPLLREAAMQAVRQWRYRPQICKTTGAKMSVIAPITVLFVSR